MQYIIEGRGTGKTTRLIKMCADNDQSIIVCTTNTESKRIQDVAKKMGLTIPLPVSLSDIKAGKLQGAQYKDCYIDNLELFIQMFMGGVNVKAVTMSNPVDFTQPNE